MAAVDDRTVGPNVDRLKNLTLLDWLLSAAIILAAGVMVRAAFVQGIGYDAAFDMEAFLTVSAIPDSTELAQAYELAPITSEFYGLITFQVASMLAGLTGQSLDPNTFSSYLTHHLVISGLALLGAIAAGVSVAWATASRTAGLLTTALISFTPLWLGMGSMNYKDMPVASGLSLLSLGLTLIGRGSRPSARLTITAFLLAGLGSFIALGTRAGAIALVGALIGLTALVRLVHGLRHRNFTPLLLTLVLGAWSLLFSALGLLLTNPFARIDLLRWMQDSIEISRNYVWVGVIRTAGQDLPSDQLPWWYAPAWLLAQLPILTTVLIALGLVVLAWITIKGKAGLLDRSTIGALSPLLIQGWVLPMLIIASGAVLYDGIRHLTFALPGILAVAALPLAAVLSSTRRNIPVSSRATKVLVIASAVVLIASAFATLRWYPYTYAFINPIAGLQKEPRAWELDYWGLTSREGMDRLRAQGLTAVAVEPAEETGRPFGVTNKYQATEVTAATGIAHGSYVFRRWDLAFRQDWCTRTFTIERDGQILGEGGTCP